MFPLSKDSDKIILTLRMTKDGKREWLDAPGRTPLIFPEKDYWLARKSAHDLGTKMFLTEQEAMDYLFNPIIEELRDKVAAKLAREKVLKGF